MQLNITYKIKLFRNPYSTIWRNYLQKKRAFIIQGIYDMEKHEFWTIFYSLKNSETDANMLRI